MLLHLTGGSVPPPYVWAMYREDGRWKLRTHENVVHVLDQDHSIAAICVCEIAKDHSLMLCNTIPTEAEMLRDQIDNQEPNEGK